MLEMQSVRMEVPAETNIIVGQSHFIKTVEDLYEAVATTVPQAKFGLAFNESSGACLTRSDGNDQTLRNGAIHNAQALACGHTFVLLLQNDIPHQCAERNPQCAGGVFHILCYRQPSGNHRCSDGAGQWCAWCN